MDEDTEHLNEISTPKSAELEFPKLTLIHLPTAILESIVLNLSYIEIMKVRQVCRVFQEVSSRILKSKFEKLTPKLENEMITLRDEMTRSHVPGVNLGLMLLYNVLKILVLDLHVFKATCWRYMKTNSNCFFAGDVLNELNRAYILVKSRQINKDNEPEVTTRIFFKNERFMNFFDDYCDLLEEKTFFGTKLIDTLDCCSNRDYKLTLRRMGECFNIKGFYEIHDISTIDMPPEFSKYKTTSEKLKVLGQYIRNNVRWNNLFNPLKELWDTEDELEKGISFTKLSTIFIENTRRYEQQTIIDGRIVHKTSQKFQESYDEKLGLRCEVDLYCTRDQLPFQFESKDDLENVNTVARSLEQLDKQEEVTSANRQEDDFLVIDTPKFFMDVIVRYPESWRDTHMKRTLIHVSIDAEEVLVSDHTEDTPYGVD